jgi:hypothetical protein
MPVTPFHFGPGAAVHALAPTRVSFIAFCVANVLIDVESGYNLLMAHDRLHAFLHTYVGASLIVLAVPALHGLLRAAAEHWRLPNLFAWRELTRGQVIFGAALGGYSHVLLDSVMHADMTPLAPFTNSNYLHGTLSWDVLHGLCVALGIAGIAILVIRGIVARRRAAESLAGTSH